MRLSSEDVQRLDGYDEVVQELGRVKEDLDRSQREVADLKQELAFYAGSSVLRLRLSRSEDLNAMLRQEILKLEARLALSEQGKEPVQ